MAANSSSFTHGIKWVDYIDPYGRYSLKYPSDWIIQTEAVHTDTFVNDVPFKVCGTHNDIMNQCILVNQIPNDVGFNAREVASNFQNDLEVTSSPSQVVHPISCGYRDIAESCQYTVVTGTGLLKDIWEVVSFVDPTKRAYILLYTVYYPRGVLKGQDISYILESFSITNSNANENRDNIPPVFHPNEASVPPVFSSNKSSIPPVFKSGNNNSYKSDSIGVQVDYPNNWSKTEKDLIVYLVPNNEAQPNAAPQFQKVYLLLGIDTTVNDNSISLENYLEYAKTQLQSRNVEFGQANKTMLAGEPGYTIFYTNQNGNRGEIFVVTHGSKPYLISYVAVPEKFNQYLPVIHNILSSLKFT